jgi:hypothetical protein
MDVVIELNLESWHIQKEGEKEVKYAWKVIFNVSRIYTLIL